MVAINLWELQIDDVNHETYLLKEWGEERELVYKALQKIANSENIDKLIESLYELRYIYISNKSIGSKNLNKVINNINFDLLKAIKHFDRQFEEFNKLNEKSNKKYFIYGSIIAMIIGIIMGFIFSFIR